MIPSTNSSRAVPPTTGTLRFHVIIDDINCAFSVDGPNGPNGVRLHYEMVQVAREQNRKLRDFDLWAESLGAALALIKNYFPASTFLGTWADAKKVCPTSG
jgi:hypothetical protein